MPKRIEVTLPTLHPDQVRAYRAFQAAPLGLVLRAGRRWGKTDFDKTIAGDAAIKGQPVGWFAPDYKISSEAFNEIAAMLEPVKRSSSKVEGVIRTIKGGRIDFWTLDNERAGRSRKYKLVIIDEAAFTKPNMMEIWEQSIKPTLLDLGGKAIVSSNTNGNDPGNFLYSIDPENDKEIDPESGRVGKYGFSGFHAPTRANPLIPLRKPGETDEQHALRRLAVFEKLKADNHPLVFQQEYLAEFVDFSGVAFFGRDKLLVDDAPVPRPARCEYVFAIVDTATKTAATNDGTAVTYYAVLRHHPEAYRLVVLDWDIQQIEGSLLEAWLPSVFQNLEALSLECGARGGVAGTWIEDKASAMVLLQQARRNDWPAQAIESKLTAAGKDARALNVSGFVYRGEVKISQQAFDKVTSYKGQTRNHFLAQVFGYRVGIDGKDDDLLDTFTYGIAIGIGNAGGF